MPTEDGEVETPLEPMTVPRISGKKVAVCPVLRAGVGMLDGVLSLVSSARVGFVGMYRDEETLEPVQYYLKLPTTCPSGMRSSSTRCWRPATRAVAAIAAVKEAGAQSVTAGLHRRGTAGNRGGARRASRTCTSSCAAVDRGLNEHGFIVPGLGDAGDRLYGTK